MDINREIGASSNFKRQDQNINNNIENKITHLTKKKVN
jgi:hypothetical protein